MNCIFLGSSGGLNTEKRHSTSLLFNNEQGGLLIDCNGACTQRLAALDFDYGHLQHIFLTHRHIDHIGALGVLIQQIWLKSVHYISNPDQKRRAPLHIYTGADTIKAVQALFHALEVFDHPNMFDIVFHKLNKDGGALNILGQTYQYIPVIHGVPCHGLRTKINGKQLAFTADSEICDTLYHGLSDGDILIHECDSFEDKSRRGHSTWHEMQSLIADLPELDIYLAHLPAFTEARESEIKSELIEKYGARVKLAEDLLKIKF